MNISLSRCLTSEVTSITEEDRTPSEGSSSRLISFSIASPVLACGLSYVVERSKEGSTNKGRKVPGDHQVELSLSSKVGDGS